MQPIPESLFLALDFYREPRRFESLRRPDSPLPRGIGEVLAAPAGCLADDNIAATAAALKATPEDCREAVLFFIKQLLFEVPGDHYRALGVERGAEQAQIKSHYFYLMRLFHPDRDTDDAGWDDLYAPRINEAYNVLRNPGKRAAYDAEQAAGDGFGPLTDGATAAPGAASSAVAPGPSAAAPVNPALRPETTATQPRPASPATRSGGVSVLRSPWLYAGLVLLCVATLFAVLFASNQTSQLQVSQGAAMQSAAMQDAQDASAPASFDSLQAVQQRNAGAGTAAANVTVSAETVAVASQQAAADENIEALVQARVEQATRAVLGARRAVTPAPVRAEPERVARSAHVQATGRAPQQRGAVAVQIETTATETAVAPETGVALVGDVIEKTAEVAAAPAVAIAAEPEASLPTKRKQSVEPAVAISTPAAITRAELKALLQAFTAHYESGDADAFAALFAADAHTTDASGRASIRQLYADFFTDNTVQGVRFSQVRWDEGATRRSGTARVRITTAPQAGGEASTVAAELGLEVVRVDDGLQISRMTY